MEDYEFLDNIGDGAQGVVYRVRHTPTKNDYAMKVIRCLDQTQVNSALKEIKVLLQLRHHHVVSYTDFFLLFHSEKLKSEFLHADSLSQSTLNTRLYSTEGTDRGIGSGNDNGASTGSNTSAEIAVCLVMELCTNGDMQGAIRDAKQGFMEKGCHPTGEAQVLTWLEQCATALQFIHEKGFLHRDVKPRNIFFDASRDVKVGDFGLAVNVGLGRKSVVGTPYYLAPERMLHQTYDGKVDVWGLGVVFLELCTLRERPINSQVLENPLVIDKIVKEVESMGFSAKLGNLLRDMLQRYPSDRPSPVEVARRVASIIAGSQESNNSSVPINGLGRPKSTAPAVCDLCEVETAVAACAPCAAVYCVSCDRARHKHHSRQSHERTSLLDGARLLSNTSGSTTVGTIMTTSVTSRAHGENTSGGRSRNWNSNVLGRSLKDPSSLVTSGGAGMSASVTLGSVTSSIRVPQDFASLDEALLSVVSMPHVRKIIVAGGSMFSSAVELSDRLPDGIAIVGLDPAPVLEVSKSKVAVTIRSGRGTLHNFVVRQAEREVHSGEKRPLAVNILGGEWTLSRCRVSCSGGSGICVAAGVDPIVRECMIVDVKQAGIQILASGRGLYEKNRIAGCEYAGILLKRDSSPRICNNTIQDGAETGIFCQDSNGTIEGNFIADNRGCGIVIKGPECSPIIRRNRIVGNAQAGFFCCDRSAPIITENEVRANKKAGLLIKTHASPKVTRNIVQGGDEAGVYVFEFGEGTIEDNEILENANAGVLVTTSGAPHVLRNTISRNYYEGVWVCKGGGGTFCDNDLRHNDKGPKDVEQGCVVVWLGNKETA